MGGIWDPQQERKLVFQSLEVGFFRSRHEFQPSWCSPWSRNVLHVLLGKRGRRLRLQILAPRNAHGLREAYHDRIAARGGWDDYEEDWIDGEDDMYKEYRLEFLFRDVEFLGMQKRETQPDLPWSAARDRPGCVALAFWIKCPPYVYTRPNECEAFEDSSPPPDTYEPEKLWARAGDFSEGSLAVAKVMFVVVSETQEGEIPALVEALCGPSGHILKRRNPCKYWGIEDLDRVKILESTFEPPSPLKVFPFVTLSATFDTENGRPEIPSDVLLLLTILVQKGLVPPSSLTLQLYTFLSEATTKPGREGKASKAECKADLIHFINTYRRPIFDLVAHIGRLQARRDARASRVSRSSQIESASKRQRQSAEGGARVTGSGQGVRRLSLQDQPLPEGYCRVPRLQITPLGAEAQEPTLELCNGVLRHFAGKDLSHGFLRVSFLDEDLTPLSPCAFQQPPGLSRPNELYQRILYLVSKGFTFCGRRYRFLAASASQLREHSAWFLAQDGRTPALRVEAVFSWMGNFWNIQNTATFAARLGQSFSSHLLSLDLLAPLALPANAPAHTRGTPGASASAHLSGPGDGSTRTSATASAGASTSASISEGLVSTGSDSGQAKVMAKVRCIRDIKNRKGKNFTDGIGRISPELARALLRMLAPNLERIGGVVLEPSAFQVRLAGAKGVLAVWPRDVWYTPESPGSGRRASFSVGNIAGRGTVGVGSQASAVGDSILDSGESGEVHVWLRDSMVKFESQRTNLEVVNWSRFMPCYLNRQIITLLSTLGVPDRVFLDLQHQMVQQLDEAMVDPDRAMVLLARIGEDGGHGSPMAMLRAGVRPQEDPHLRHMLLAIRERQLQDLIRKARIFLKEGRRLMGIVDEAGVLEYNECFIQVTDPARPGTPVVIQGPVAFAKNPCLHPGDVRFLTAVGGARAAPLAHQRDVVVLPQKGPRSHCSEASGSDLDGDIYFCSWHPGLAHHMRSDEPMGYHAQAKEDGPVMTSRTSRMEAVHKFFVDYMVNANLGVICNAHVVHADESPLKARNPSCLRLALEASKAVDFPKTGIPGVMPRELRVTRYPDFMAKGDKDSYVSESVQGRLYRRVLGAAQGPGGFWESYHTTTNNSTGTSYSTGASSSGGSGTADGEGEGAGGEWRRGRGPQRMLGPQVSVVVAAYHRGLLEGLDFGAHMEEARANKGEYDQWILEIMAHNSLATEAELVTRTFVSLADFNKGRATMMKERARLELGAALREFRHRLLFGTPLVDPSRAVDEGDATGDGSGYTVGDNPGYTGDSNDGSVDVRVSSLDPAALVVARARAAAWYHVTYDGGEIREGREMAGFDDDEEDEDAPTTPILLSFAWIGVDLLVHR